MKKKVTMDKAKCGTCEKFRDGECMKTYTLVGFFDEACGDYAPQAGDAKLARTDVLE